MNERTSKWKVFLVLLTLVLANLALGSKLLQAEPEGGGICATTGVCYCHQPGDIRPQGAGFCHSLGSGSPCGKGNGGTGYCMD